MSSVAVHLEQPRRPRTRGVERKNRENAASAVVDRALVEVVVVRGDGLLDVHRGQQRVIQAVPASAANNLSDSCTQLRTQFALQEFGLVEG